MEMNYNNTLLTAVDVVIDGRLREIAYDKTIICIITDASRKSEGYYKVINGDMEFEAISESDKYREKDQVYVMIPEGDFTKQKVIISKYNAEDRNKPIIYASPLETVVPMTQNLIQENREVGIVANGGEQKKAVNICSIDLTDPTLDIDVQNNNIFNVLGVRAKFKTLFGNRDVREGNYGLQITLIGTSLDGADFNESGYFDIKENNMLGNPYNYTAYFEQEKAIDISKLSKIKSISVMLIQDNDFYYWDGNIRKKLSAKQIVPVKDKGQIIPQEKDVEANIFVTDIELFFGNNIAKIPDNTFQIYSNDALTYSASKGQDNPNYNIKNIYSMWYNKNNENHEFIGFSDGEILRDEETKEILEYDEISYLNEFNSTMQGVSTIIKPIPDEDEPGETRTPNIPQVRQGLQIYANAYKLNDYFKSIYNKINYELSDVVKRVKTYTKEKAIEDIDDLINNAEQAIDDVIISIDTITAFEDDDSSVRSLYISWLESYGAFYDLLKEDINTVITKDPSIQEYLSNITLVMNNYLGKYLNLLSELGTLFNVGVMKTLYNNYSNLRYDLNNMNNLYTTRLKTCDDLVIKSSNIYSQQQNLCSELDSRLTNSDIQLRDITAFENEYANFTEKYRNKYCIYWYHYNPELLKTTTNDPFLGAPWDRIDTSNYPIKPGMPDLDSSNEKYTKKSEVGLTNLEMDCSLKEEKFKAVLFYNHEAFWSEELIFKNEDPISDVPPQDGLSIELGENASLSFPLYGITGDLSPGDSTRIRELRVRYNNGTIKDELLANAFVFWYMPKSETMLVCPDEKLLEKGFYYLNPNDPNYLGQNFSSYLRDKYNCYFKQMGSVEDLDENDKPFTTVKISDTKFYFQISNLYRSSSMNNRIYCLVVTDEASYEADISFSFGHFGTAGTQYTLSIIPASGSNQSALINIGDDIYPLELEARFTDCSNKELSELESPTISWSWQSPNKGLDIIENNKGKNCRSISGTLYESPPVCLYNVLECSAVWNRISDDIVLDDNQALTLKTYYPVAFSTGYYYVDCPNMIIYNDMGLLDNQNYRTKLRIYNSQTGVEIPNVSWSMLYFSSGENSAGFKPAPDDFAFLNKVPRIETTTAKDSNIIEYTLIPQDWYETDFEIRSVAICRDENDNLLWVQPIVILQNRWGSTILNNWDGKLTIDKDNNIVLSAAMVAGQKDGENRFTGVVMGRMDTLYEDANDLLTDSKVTGFGLYGLLNGAPSFGFTEKGTGFIGTSGSGRILFDGKESTIKSGSRDKKENQNNKLHGLMLDFDHGILDILGSKDSHIVIQELDPYLSITSPNGTEIMRVGDTEYFLQTDNFTTSSPTQAGAGFKLDLANNRLTGYDFDLEAKSADGKSYIELGIQDGDEAYPYLRVHRKDDDAWGQDLLVIDKNQYFLQSYNYDIDKHTGIRFDLLDGTLTGYNFKLYTLNNRGQSIELDSQALDYPFTVNGGIYTNGKQTKLGIFQVGWDGSMCCGDHFWIEADGTMHAEKAIVGGWEVGPTTITAGGTTFNSQTGSISNGGASWSGGILIGTNIKDSTLNNLTVNGTLTVEDGGSFDIAGDATFTGKTTFNGDLDINGNLTLPAANTITIGDETLEKYVETHASVVSLFSNNDAPLISLFSKTKNTYQNVIAYGLSGSYGEGLADTTANKPVYFSSGRPVAFSIKHRHYIECSASGTINTNAGTFSGTLKGWTDYELT